MVTRLRNRIALCFFSLLMLSALAIITSVLIATNNSVNKAALEKLKVGENVFKQLIFERGNQLIRTARVLVADFGFKEAVTSNDIPTITSALENNRSRINADLMVLLTLEGDVITSNLGTNINKSMFDDLLSMSKAEGSGIAIVLLNNAIYQLVILPVKAPIPVAWSIIGKQIDFKFAMQLKSLTDLEVIFNAQTKNNKLVRASTINTEITFSKKEDDEQDNYLFLNANEHKYLTLSVNLTKNKHSKIEALLSTSLSTAYEKYSPLMFQIITIATMTLILSMIIAIFVARNITRPIQYLASAAFRISSGDYRHSIQRQQSSIEIQRLSESFQSMQNGIALREEQLSSLAYTDSLTGSANRTSLIDHLNKNFITVENSKTTVVKIYIKNFKEVNHSFGYDFGDELLIAFAQVLSSYANGQHFVARLDAAEFCIVLNDCNTNTIMTEMVYLQSILEASMSINGLCVKNHVTLGVAHYPAHGNEAEQLLRRCEIALNHAKDNSEHCTIYLEGEEERHLRKITLINDLKTALQKDRLNVFYQAKIDLTKNAVTQAEALLRWTHPEYGFISPEEFITLAEQTGHMPTLTNWMLSKVCDQIVNWQKEDINITVAINLSACDLSIGFPETISDRLSKHALTPDQVMLEITESAVMSKPDEAIKVLNQLKKRGFSLSIDDFGTGYSSLSQLKNMPVDELKIDKSFVLNLDSDPEDQAIVKSTIELAHNIGLSVVAEGVETEKAYALLKEWGCNKLQGYYISRPISSEDFSTWFKEYNVPKI